MPVTDRHPLYAKHAQSWRKQRLVIEGEDAVKAAGRDFLPSLDGDTEADYEKYKMRASFYEATGRTARALIGELFRKEPTVTFPGSEEILASIGKGGESLSRLMVKTTEEQVAPARAGILVDAGEEDGSPPYAALYCGEHITNWRTERVGGMDKLVLVVLLEEVPADDREDEFSAKTEDQYRVLRLTQIEGSEDPVYIQQVYTEHKRMERGNEVTEYQLESTVIPRGFGGRTFSEIPFVFFNASNNDPDPDQGPLQGLANLNLSLYRNSADLEHGRHFTALPTGVLSGFQTPDDGVIRLGSSQCIVSEDPNSKAFFMEFNGTGLGSIEKGMIEKKKEMAAIGARLLEDPKEGVEAADTVRLRTAGEFAALASIADAASSGWTRVLELVAFWRAITTKPTVEFNKDFSTARLAAEDVQQYMLQVQAGLMSYATYFYNLKRGEIYPDGWTEDDERRSIEAGPPQGAPMPDPADPSAAESDTSVV